MTKQAHEYVHTKSEAGHPRPVGQGIDVFSKFKILFWGFSSNDSHLNRHNDVNEYILGGEDKF